MVLKYTLGDFCSASQYTSVKGGRKILIHPIGSRDGWKRNGCLRDGWKVSHPKKGKDGWMEYCS